MVEYDRQRMIKDSLLEQIIATCVETADAGRLLVRRVGPADGMRRRRRSATRRWRVDRRAAGRAGRRRRGRRASIGPSSSSGSPQQELLYVPLAKGGKPRRIVRARTLGQLLHDLLELAAATGPDPRNVPIARHRPDDGGRAPGRPRRGHRIRPAVHLRLPGDRPLPRRVGRRLGRRARAGRQLDSSSVRPSDDDARRSPAGPHRVAAQPLARPTAARCG